MLKRPNEDLMNNCSTKTTLHSKKRISTAHDKLIFAYIFSIVTDKILQKFISEVPISLW